MPDFKDLTRRKFIHKVAAGALASTLSPGFVFAKDAKEPFTAYCPPTPVKDGFLIGDISSHDIASISKYSYKKKSLEHITDTSVFMMGIIPQKEELRYRLFVSDDNECIGLIGKYSAQVYASKVGVWANLYTLMNSSLHGYFVPGTHKFVYSTLLPIDKADKSKTAINSVLLESDIKSDRIETMLLVTKVPYIISPVTRMKAGKKEFEVFFGISQEGDIKLLGVDLEVMKATRQNLVMDLAGKSQNKIINGLVHYSDFTSPYFSGMIHIQHEGPLVATDYGLWENPQKTRDMRKDGQQFVAPSYLLVLQLGHIATNNLNKIKDFNPQSYYCIGWNPSESHVAFVANNSKVDPICLYHGTNPINVNAPRGLFQFARWADDNYLLYYKPEQKQICRLQVLPKQGKEEVLMENVEFK